MNLIDRAKNLFGVRKSTGSAGPIPSSWPNNWYQLGMGTNSISSAQSSVVEACVSAYSQTISQMPLSHTRIEKDGSRTYIEDSNVAAILRNPNYYQTASDFLTYMIRSILFNGNAYFIGDGSSPAKHTEIFSLDPAITRGHHIPDTGDIFYSTGGSFAEMAGENDTVMIPSRYIGHAKWTVENDPLYGITPIRAAASSVSANNSIVNHQAAFFSNMSRPSGVLTTEQELNRTQMDMLRSAWDEQSKSLNSGGVPILANGMGWQSLSMTSQDAELVAAWKMTVEDISRVFRVPPMLINNMENATFSNASALMEFWLSSGLGFMISHIEQTMKDFFGLPQNEYIRFDTEILMRSNLEGRIKALGEAVTKGIYSPNEARAREFLPPVEGGDMPRVQQQMVPLDWEHPDPNEELSADTQAEEDQPVEDEEIDDEEEAEKMLYFLAKSEMRGLSLENRNNL